jgi:hypothetical protein
MEPVLLITTFSVISGAICVGADKLFPLIKERFEKTTKRSIVLKLNTGEMVHVAVEPNMSSERITQLVHAALGLVENPHRSMTVSRRPPPPPSAT